MPQPSEAPTLAPTLCPTAVASTTLVSVAYDDARQLLQLEFQSRAVYWFFGVPPTVHQSLLAAASKGAYFNHHIRNRFPFQRRADTRQR
jgi:hypothetical protein